MLRHWPSGQGLVSCFTIAHAKLFQSIVSNMFANCHVFVRCRKYSCYDPILSAISTPPLLNPPGASQSNLPPQQTASPTTLTPEKVLTYVGSTPPSDSLPLSACFGDCDKDEDCKPGLVCVNRHADEEVVGCSGNAVAGVDYCNDLNSFDSLDVSTTPSPTTMPRSSLSFAPTQLASVKATSGASATSETVLEITTPETVLTFLGGMPPSDAFPLNMCEGDCDADEDCDGELLCFKRNGDEEIPGCTGSAVSGEDYCFLPTDNMLQDALTVPLGPCQGDCGNDNDCDTGLECFKRKKYEQVPGCDGQGSKGWNYCYKNPDVSASDNIFSFGA